MKTETTDCKKENICKKIFHMGKPMADSCWCFVETNTIL